MSPTPAPIKIYPALLPFSLYGSRVFFFVFPLINTSFQKLISCISNIASRTATFTSPPVGEFPLRCFLLLFSSFFFFHCCVSAFPSVAGDYRSQEMKELPIREGAASYCTRSYRPLRIPVSLARQTWLYSSPFCHFCHTPLPAPAIQPLAIYPDMCNQLELQILAGIKK